MRDKNKHRRLQQHRRNNDVIRLNQESDGESRLQNVNRVVCARIDAHGNLFHMTGPPRLVGPVERTNEHRVQKWSIVAFRRLVRHSNKVGANIAGDLYRTEYCFSSAETAAFWRPTNIQRLALRLTCSRWHWLQNTPVRKQLAARTRRPKQICMLGMRVWVGDTPHNY